MMGAPQSQHALIRSCARWALAHSSRFDRQFVVLRVTYVEFYIVPRTGVFTTYTRLNTGLRLQRGPELDGDLERELHQ